MSTSTETLFTPLTIETAPQTSKPALEKIQKSLGFIPNLMATFANRMCSCAVNAVVLDARGKQDDLPFHWCEGALLEHRAQGEIAFQDYRTHK